MEGYMGMDCLGGYFEMIKKIDLNLSYVYNNKSI
jgi:hypothetical protein